MAKPIEEPDDDDDKDNDGDESKVEPEEDSKQMDILLDGDFAADNGDFYQAGPNFVSTVHIGKSWVYPRGHKWNKDLVNEYAFADNAGAPAMTQGVLNNNQLQGLAELKFKAKHSGLNDTLRFQVIGLDSEFRLSNWSWNPNATNGTSYLPQPINEDEVVSYKVIYDSENFAATEFDWTEFTIPDLDLGTGYKYIVIKVFTNGVEADQSEELLIDDVSLAPPPAPLVAENILLDSDFAAINGDFYGNTGTFVSTAHIGKSWIKPNGDKWNKDLVNEYAFADNAGADAIIQGNLDDYQSQGLATLKFKAKHTGSGDNLKFVIFGVNDDDFKLSNWQSRDSRLGYFPYTDAEAVTIDYSVIHDSVNYADSEYDWTEFTIPDLDLASGYKYLVIKVITSGVDNTAGEELLLDDLELLN